MKLKELMITDVIQASPDKTIADSAKRMHIKGVGCLVVTVDGTIKGIITDRDLLDCLAQGHDPYRCTVAVHLHRPVYVLGPEEDHVAAAEVLRRRKIKRLPIAEKGKLLGIVSLSDLAVLAEKETATLVTVFDYVGDLVHAQSARRSVASLAPAARYSSFRGNGIQDDNIFDVGGPR